MRRGGRPKSTRSTHLSVLRGRSPRPWAACRPATAPRGVPAPGRGESGGQTQPHRFNRAVTVPAHGACLGAGAARSLPEPRAAATAAPRPVQKSLLGSLVERGELG